MIVLYPNVVKVYFFLSHLIHKEKVFDLMEKPSILDCGAGGDLPPLTIFFNEGFECEGLDISIEQIEKAEKYCHIQKIDIHFQQGDMRAMPYSEERFDFVYEYYSMCHLNKADTSHAVDEIYRVLKPGGLCQLGMISMDSWPKSLYGEERETGEFHSEYGLHTMFTDNEADSLVSRWTIVSKEKEVKLLRTSVESVEMDEWLALQGDGNSDIPKSKWEELYKDRMNMYNYSYIFYILRKE